MKEPGGPHRAHHSGLQVAPAKGMCQGVSTFKAASGGNGREKDGRNTGHHTGRGHANVPFLTGNQLVQGLPLWATPQQTETLPSYLFFASHQGTSTGFDSCLVVSRVCLLLSLLASRLPSLRLSAGPGPAASPSWKGPGDSPPQSITGPAHRLPL